MKMKKLSSVFIAIIAASGFLLAACATTIKTTAPDELDIAIRDASDYLNDNIPRRSKIVILNMQSDSAALSEYIIDELISNAVNDRIFTVVDRAQLDLIRAEQNIQYSGEVDDNDQLAIGRFLGAQYIITGTISELGERYRMRIRALNVQTAQVQGQYNRNVAAGATITALMRSRSGGTVAASRTTRTTAGAAQAQHAGAANGIYTFWPRLRPTRAGLNVNDVFIPQVTVTKDFIVIHFCRNAAGAWADEEWNSGISGFYDARNFTLQNLDNPSQFYTPVTALSTSNGMGRIWALSYRRFNATRLQLIGKQYDSGQPFVFEEIILDKPDA